ADVTLDRNVYRKRGVVGGLLAGASRLEAMGYPAEAATLRQWVDSVLREALGIAARVENTDGP
ncbi:MAG TPA: hypothetical protein VNM37_25435, partial [Candidatus Dormibacteraeota bacterium]|nr:hypothetical protein [Candidatus Dormibacteraeota bacterium]